MCVLANAQSFQKSYNLRQLLSPSRELLLGRAARLRPNTYVLKTPCPVKMPCPVKTPCPTPMGYIYSLYVIHCTATQAGASARAERCAGHRARAPRRQHGRRVACPRHQSGQPGRGHRRHPGGHPHPARPPPHAPGRHDPPLAGRPTSRPIPRLPASPPPHATQAPATPAPTLSWPTLSWPSLFLSALWPFAQAPSEFRPATARPRRIRSRPSAGSTRAPAHRPACHIILPEPASPQRRPKTRDSALAQPPHTPPPPALPTRSVPAPAFLQKPACPSPPSHAPFVTI